MSRSSLTALVATAVLSAPAFSKPCAALLTPADASGGPIWDFTFTSLGMDGTADFGKGSVKYAPSFMIQGPSGKFPRPQSWTSQPNQPGKLFQNAGEAFAQGSKLGPFIDNKVTLKISGTNSPSVTVTYIDAGKTFTFSATCSDADVLHGSSAGRDFLIHLQAPKAVL